MSTITHLFSWDALYRNVKSLFLGEILTLSVYHSLCGFQYLKRTKI